MWQDASPTTMAQAFMQILTEQGMAVSVAPPTPQGADIEMEELSESEEEVEPSSRKEGATSAGSTAKPKGKRSVPKAEALKIRETRNKKKLSQ